MSAAFAGARGFQRATRVCLAVACSWAALASGCRVGRGAGEEATADGRAEPVDAGVTGVAPSTATESKTLPPPGADRTSPVQPSSDPAESTLPEAYRSASLVSATSIGHTSVVFKLAFASGAKAAYKPRSRRGGDRYRGEVASYRLARALGLDNVPPAYLGDLDGRDLLRALGGEHSTTAAPWVAESPPARDGKVPGAFLPWIDRLTFLPIEKGPRKRQWRAWLSGQTPIDPLDRPLAAQISTLIVFDYITGNWDRWSGGNVGYDADHGRVLFIDNDGAFLEHPPASMLSAQRELLAGVDRFSFALVEKLRDLDWSRALSLEPGDGPSSEPLLRATVVRDADARRRDALDLIDTKVKGRGEAEVLCF